VLDSRRTVHDGALGAVNTLGIAERSVPVWEAAGFLGMSAEVLLGTYRHHHPDFLYGMAANAITSKNPVLLAESVVNLGNAREKGKNPNDYLVGVSGFEPATPRPKRNGHLISH
jgi:hypothetical protein